MILLHDHNSLHMHSLREQIDWLDILNLESLDPSHILRKRTRIARNIDQTTGTDRIERLDRHTNTHTRRIENHNIEALALASQTIQSTRDITLYKHDVARPPLQGILRRKLNSAPAALDTLDNLGLLRKRKREVANATAKIEHTIRLLDSTSLQDLLHKHTILHKIRLSEDLRREAERPVALEREEMRTLLTLADLKGQPLRRALLRHDDIIPTRLAARRAIIYRRVSHSDHTPLKLIDDKLHLRQVRKLIEPETTHPRERIVDARVYSHARLDIHDIITP